MFCDLQHLKNKLRKQAFLNGMAHVAHSREGIWLGEAYDNDQLSNLLVISRIPTL